MVAYVSFSAFGSAQRLAYRGEAAAHVSISHREAGLIDGLLKDQVDDPFEPLLCVDGQICHLLHQLVELLRRQLVQDASYLPEELLWGINQNRYSITVSISQSRSLEIFLDQSKHSSSLFFLFVFAACVDFCPCLCFLHLCILRRAFPLQAGFPGVLGLFQLNIIVNRHVHDDLPGRRPTCPNVHEL